MKKRNPKTKGTIDDEYAIKIYIDGNIEWDGFDKYLVKHPRVCKN